MGFIFMCRAENLRVNFDTGVFGMPYHKWDLLSTIDPKGCDASPARPPPSLPPPPSVPGSHPVL